MERTMQSGKEYGAESGELGYPVSLQKQNNHGMTISYFDFGCIIGGEGIQDSIVCSYPVSLNIDPAFNYLYISDLGNKRIEIFDQNGKYINEWGSSGVSNGQFKRPVSVSFADNGQVYVVDKDRGDIQVFGVPPTSPKVIKKTTTTVKKGQEQPSINNPAPRNETDQIAISPGLSNPTNGQEFVPFLYCCEN